MKRNTLIDIIKYIMAICVIAMHTYSNKTVEVGRLYHTVVSSAVPFFFMASGYLTNVVEQSSQVAKGRIIRYIRLYIIWNIVYMPAAIYGNLINNDSVIKSILLYFRGFFLIGEHYMSWPLWYLLSMIYLLAAIKYLKSRLIKDETIWMISAVVYVIATVMTKMAESVDYAIYYDGTVNIAAKLIKITFGGGRLFTGLLLYCAGWILAVSKQKGNFLFSCNRTASNIFALMGLCICFMISVIRFNAITGTILVPAIILYLCIVNGSIIKKQTSIGFQSTVMYYTHMLIYFVVILIFYNGKPRYGLTSFLTVTVIDCMISAVVSKFRTNKLVKMLF